MKGIIHNIYLCIFIIKSYYIPYGCTTEVVIESSEHLQNWQFSNVKFDYYCKTINEFLPKNQIFDLL